MQVNYIQAVTEIQNCYPQNLQNIRKLFTAVIDNKQYLPESLGEALNQVKYTYSMVCPRREIVRPPYRQIFDGFLSSCKTNLSRENNALFLRYLSIYATGQISHKVFVRLFLSLVNGPNKTENKLVQDLPAFMSALNSGVFFDIRKEYVSEVDAIATELVISATSKSQNVESSKSLSKCLFLLSSGTIRPSVAKKWLAHFCTPEIIKKLDQIDDFSLFYPGRFPSQIVMSSSFETSEPAKNIFELYRDNMRRRYDPHSLRPVVIDILELKMKEIRHLILTLSMGEKINPSLISFVYGDEKAHEITSKQSHYTIPVVMRLIKLFTECHDLLEGILTQKMSEYKPDDFEYRILYKKMLNHKTFAFFYELPGCRTIKFGTQHAADVAIAATKLFATRVFGEEELASILRSLDVLLPLFSKESEGKYFVVNEKPIHSVVYLGEIAKRIKMQGNVEEVVVRDDYTFAPIEEQGEYGKALYTMLDNIRKEENALKGSMAVCDIALIRAVRALNEVEMETLLEFPENVEKVNIYMTMTRVEEPEFGLMCCSAFSPCFTEGDYEVPIIDSSK